ncbi:unnamed protein product [Lathyrus oleraceus]
MVLWTANQKDSLCTLLKGDCFLFFHKLKIPSSQKGPLSHSTPKKKNTNISWKDFFSGSLKRKSIFPISPHTKPPHLLQSSFLNLAGNLQITVPTTNIVQLPSSISHLPSPPISKYTRKNSDLHLHRTPPGRRDTLLLTSINPYSLNCVLVSLFCQTSQTVLTSAFFDLPLNNLRCHPL